MILALHRGGLKGFLVKGKILTWTWWTGLRTGERPELGAVGEFSASEQVNPFHPSQTQRRVGHLQGLGQNLGVNCSSGIILPERPQLWNRGDSAGRVRHPLDNTRVHLIVGPAISDLASLSVS